MDFFSPCNMCFFFFFNCLLSMSTFWSLVPVVSFIFFQTSLRDGLTRILGRVRGGAESERRSDLGRGCCAVRFVTALAPGRSHREASLDRGFGTLFSAHAGMRLRNRGTPAEGAPHGLRGVVRARQRSAIMPMADAKKRETEDFAAHGDGVDGAVVDFCVRGVGRGWRDWHTGRQTGRGRAGGGKSLVNGRRSY